MKSLKKFATQIPVFIIIGIIFFCGLKSCIYVGWNPPEANTSYAIIGEGGEEMQLTFLEDRKALLVYGDPRSDAFELVSLDFGWGEQCTHYFGPLYNVSREAKSPFGLRWVKDSKPARISYTIENKYMQGFGDSSFGKKGAEYETVIYENDDSFKFSGMWLSEVETDTALINEVSQILNN